MPHAAEAAATSQSEDCIGAADANASPKQRIRADAEALTAACWHRHARATRAHTGAMSASHTGAMSASQGASAADGAGRVRNGPGGEGLEPVDCSFREYAREARCQSGPPRASSSSWR